MTDVEKSETEKFSGQVKDFAAHYLFPHLNEAKEKGVSPNIAVFALMECLQLIISGNIKDRDGAIAEFEALTTAYVKDWKQREN
ncbi:MAG: hypothetical protein OSB46_15260 [Alphaproteobacteria bacterium]|nr:hypothetical protein [Alphaproteobacteria bacterium]